MGLGFKRQMVDQVQAPSVCLNASYCILLYLIASYCFLFHLLCLLTAQQVEVFEHTLLPELVNNEHTTRNWSIITGQSLLVNEIWPVKTGQSELPNLKSQANLRGHSLHPAFPKANKHCKSGYIIIDWCKSPTTEQTNVFSETSRGPDWGWVAGTWPFGVVWETQAHAAAAPAPALCGRPDQGPGQLCRDPRAGA